MAIDTDADTVPDPIDNCTLVPNPAQCDSDNDNDGFGNYCDALLNNNFTNAQETTLFRRRQAEPPGQKGANDPD